MTISSVETICEDDSLGSRSELDSHANMVVVGRNAYIINVSGRTADVSPFSPDYNALQKVPIVDAAIAYDCPFSNCTHILLLHNALHVPSMAHNLLPPFIMREAGIVVNEVPRIQSVAPNVTDHSLWFPTLKLRIPLSLWGVFSYFITRKPSLEELRETTSVVPLTPESSSWNPHSSSYARNEESMIDWQGRLSQPTERLNILVDDLPDESPHMLVSAISSVENEAIDSLLQDVAALSIDPDSAHHEYREIGAVSTALDPFLFATNVCNRRDDGAFAASIGATNVGRSADENIEPNESVTDGMLDEFFSASSTFASTSQGVSSKHLAKVWRISQKQAERTLEVTSQRLRRSEDPKLSRNYSTNDRMLRYKRVHEYFFMDTFFATGKVGKTSRGFTMMQLFVSDKGYVFVVPMTSRTEIPSSVKMFCKAIGAPDAIITDHDTAAVSQKVKSFLHLVDTELRILEEGTPWANRAELYIGLLKEAVRKDQKAAGSPVPFWDYCFERRCRINNLTARDMHKLQGRNSHYTVHGDEGDISNLCQFEWYEFVYFRDHTAQFPLDKEVLGRCLGPATGEGNEMTQWCLKANGNVVPRRTVRPLTIGEVNSDSEKKKREKFDECIASRWGPSMYPKIAKSKKGSTPIIPVDPDFEIYQDDIETPRDILEFDDGVSADGIAVNERPLYDRLIHSEVSLPQNNKLRKAKVIGRSKNDDGSVVGTYSDNPLINSIVYDVEFSDGEVREYAANVIAENILSQVDNDGYSLPIFDSILDSKRSATAEIRSTVTTTSGRVRPTKTTHGWKILVLWKDGSESWVALKDMKESHPVETAEYACASGIDEEPAFAWWVPYTLKKRDVIVSAIKARVRKVTHKYGVVLPSTVAQALDEDKKNGNKLWTDAISKEMADVGIAFEILKHSDPTPVGWSKQSGHLIFDVKMSLDRKARWVLDGHRTPDPAGSTYAGVVSRESVRIAFTYAALNEIDVFAADIQTAYLQAPSSQKHYVICGVEFGLENVGKRALIRRALYGGKSAGRDFRNHLRECMSFLGFTSCLADPDVWMRPAKKANGDDYWEYVLLYTDDVLCVSMNTEHIIRNEIGKYFKVKEKSIGPPSIYLGGCCRNVVLANGKKAWAFGSSQYVQAAVKNVELHLANVGQKLVQRQHTPIQTSYRPELDVSPELTPKEAVYYQSLIGILRWMVELGRVDICLEVSMMSSHLALPREGHLEQVLRIFAYLKRHHNSEIVFDPTAPIIDEASFERKDWSTSEFGLATKETLPSNCPEARGLGFYMRMFVDADHAGDSITRRSRTGFIVYLNSAPVQWVSKKQTSVETSSFGSEFIAMKQGTEYLRGLRYKLRMMGIPCDEPAFVYGDNQSVLANTTIPESILKKKSHSLAYHFVREGCARDEWRTTYVSTHLNPSDLLTKTLPHGEKRRSFVAMILHYVAGTME